MRKAIIIALVAALALAAAACSSGDDESEAATPAAEDASAGGAAELGGADDAVAVSQPARDGGSLPSVGPSIVQTASLALTVPRDEFDATIQQARSIAAGFGGFVVSSTASQGDEQRLVRGSLVVRVPEPVYARAMDQLSGLGTSRRGRKPARTSPRSSSTSKRASAISRRSRLVCSPSSTRPRPSTRR